MAQVNRLAAKKLKERLIAELRSLENMPHRYPFFNEEYIPANKYRKLYVENWYLVLYQIKDATVYVDWIIDCRKDYPGLIK
jgi:plasmid stabilization system protein ParE